MHTHVLTNYYGFGRLLTWELKSVEGIPNLGFKFIMFYITEIKSVCEMCALCSNTVSHAMKGKKNCS